MDIRKLLGKLDQLNEGTMAQAKAKPTGPKFGKGKWKGTDPASAAKDKYVGGESILRDLEAKLNEDPVKRDLSKEFRAFKEAYDHNAPFNAADFIRHMEQLRAREELRKTDPMKALVGDLIDKDNAARNVKKKPQDDDSMSTSDPRHPQYAYTQAGQQGLPEGFSDLELAVMEGGHELIKEAPVAPAAPGAAPAPVAGKPTLGADLTKPAAQQDAQQQQQDQKAQQAAAQKEKQEQATLTKGVNALKSAGAAVSNPNQVVKAFDKAEDNAGLTPADKNNIASAGTVLAPIMANPQLQGKFKDLVTQASAAQKKEQQQQANQPQPAVGAPAAGQVK